MLRMKRAGKDDSKLETYESLVCQVVFVNNLK